MCFLFPLSPSFFLCPLSVCDVVLCVGVHVVSVGVGCSVVCVLVPHVELGREQHVPDSSKHSLYLMKTVQLQL